MQEITKEHAKLNHLKKLAKVRGDDISKLILLIERLKENKKIKYYSMDLIIFDTLNHKGEIEISFWGDDSKTS